jgi:hypothetical protein
MVKTKKDSSVPETITILKSQFDRQKNITILLAKFYEATQKALDGRRRGHTDGWDEVNRLAETIEETYDLTEFIFT